MTQQMITRIVRNPAAPAPNTAEPTGRSARLTTGLVATVVFLTAIAPLATDMYVPAFPWVAGELTATATQVQLTLTTFFVGMALGQLVGGADLRSARPAPAADRGHPGDDRRVDRLCARP